MSDDEWQQLMHDVDSDIEAPQPNNEWDELWKATEKRNTTSWSRTTIRYFNVRMWVFIQSQIIEDIINTPVCVNVTDTETEEVCKLVDAEYTPPTPTLPPQTCFKKECKRIDTTTLVKECKPITYQECDVQITEEVQFVKYSHAKSKKCIFKGYYGHGVLSTYAEIAVILK